MSAQPQSAAANNLTAVLRNPVLRVLYVIGVILYILTIFFATQIVAALLLIVGAELITDDKFSLHKDPQAFFESSAFRQFLYIFLVEVMAIGVIIATVKAYGAKLSAIGLRRPKLSDVLYGFAAAPVYFLIYIAVAALLSLLIPGLNLEQEQEIGFKNLEGGLQLALAFVSLVILPPLAEEIMVRGFLYSSLKKAVKTIWAVILTSLIFAIAHLPGGADGLLYVAAIDTFVLSLVLIYLREKTGGLWASMLLHAIKNGVAFTVLFVLHAR